MAEEREWSEIVRQLRSIEQTKSEKLQQLADLGSKFAELDRQKKRLSETRSVNLSSSNSINPSSSAIEGSTAQEPAATTNLSTVTQEVDDVSGHPLASSSELTFSELADLLNS